MLCLPQLISCVLQVAFQWKNCHCICKLWQDEFFVKAKGPQRCAGNPFKVTLYPQARLSLHSSRARCPPPEKPAARSVQRHKLEEIHVRNVLTPTWREHYRQQTRSNCCTILPTQSNIKSQSHLYFIAVYKRGHENS